MDATAQPPAGQHSIRARRDGSHRRPGSGRGPLHPPRRVPGQEQRSQRQNQTGDNEAETTDQGTGQTS